MKQMTDEQKARALDYVELLLIRAAKVGLKAGDGGSFKEVSAAVAATVVREFMITAREVLLRDD